ncbi:hypothetical protein HYR99_24110 [Candidatus Poribacteria bacterium]|nr:hypothetical protein [Candidatus Poribacteria bacterium]
MITDYGEFPEKKRLWPGAILASIVHAIMVSRYPDLGHEQSWDGPNYNVQDSMGSRGTITFSGAHLVGVFFDEHSPRNPFRPGSDYVLERLFTGMPANLRSLAYDEALQYVLQEYQGAIIPVFTAVFWDDGERLTAAEPWQRVFAHGAHLVRIQLMDTDAALAEWQKAYEMSSSQVTLARWLFDRKMAAPNVPIELESWERDMVVAEAKSAERLEESRTSFAEIGIILP